MGIPHVMLNSLGISLFTYQLKYLILNFNANFRFSFSFTIPFFDRWREIMRAYPTNSQMHIPQVYHHTEQRGSNPSDRVNVTTYVFQTNRNVPPSSRNKHHPHLFRSMTPQPVATYHSEDVRTIKFTGIISISLP